MILSGLFAAASSLCLIAKPISFAREGQIQGRDVPLRAVADLSGLPVGLRTRAADLVVAKLPSDRKRLDLPARYVVERARALMPALAPWLPRASDFAIVVVRQTPTSSRSQRPCARLRTALRAGAAPLADMVEAAPCPDGKLAAALRYDAETGAPRAVRDLKPGETIPPVLMSSFPVVRSGQNLHVKAVIGPVAIEREVRALQPARAHESLFVRAADGGVFAATADQVAQ